ncbi:MAG: Slp family lipoprotein [Methylococcaceae bacterium]
MKLYLLLISLVLSACSTLPPAIEDAPEFDVSYNQAVQNINNFKEAPVRWGGVIVEVENEQTRSFLQVLYYPLNSYGRPVLDDDGNPGRFVVESAEFLDPAIYAKDNLITVAGKLKGDIERTIGKKTMRLPLIAASVIHQWRNIDPYGYYGYGGFGYGGGYYYPAYRFYGYPYYGGGFYGPYW